MNAVVVAGFVMAVAGLVVVVVALVSGDRGTVRLRGESPETRREVRRAILDGGTTDPRIDALARRVARQAAGARWTVWFFGVALVASLLSLVAGSHAAWPLVQHVAMTLLWAGLVALSVINQRRLARYKGVPDS